jgi:hypothetical protein
MLKLLRALLLVGLCATPSRAANPKDFAGTWILRANDGQPAQSAETYTFELDRTWLRVVERIDDNVGRRTLDVSGALDGKPHSQTVAGSPCLFIARWEADGSLTWETRRDTPGTVFHNRRTMHLSADGKTLIARRTRLSPEPEQTWTETWERAAAESGFNGTWQLQTAEAGWSEVYTFELDRTFFRVVQRIEGGGQTGLLGKRVLDISGAIDGQPHRQTVQGYPCTLIARWQDPKTLYWETVREIPDGVLRYSRVMRLADDGLTILADRSDYSADPPAIRHEVWRRAEANP